MATHRQGWIRRTIQRFVPVGEPDPPDHKAHFVLRSGVPDLCCDKHPFYRRDGQPIRFFRYEADPIDWLNR
jgi:hypothetical protein